MVNKKMKEKTIKSINDAMDLNGCDNWCIDEADSRYIVYTCKCGKNGKHTKQNLLRPQWKGCSNCSVKISSSETRDKIKETLKISGYELLDVLKNRQIKYKCSHGEFSTYASNIMKNNFNGGCLKCSNKSEINATVEKINQEYDCYKIEQQSNDNIEIILEKSPWYGGKHKGSISDQKDRYVVSFTTKQGGTKKSFNKKQYGEHAFLEATKYRNSESIRCGLSINMIRDVNVISHHMLNS